VDGLLEVKIYGNLIFVERITNLIKNKTQNIRLLKQKTLSEKTTINANKISTI
jgi:hypothetical protein